MDDEIRASVWMKLGFEVGNACRKRREDEKYSSCEPTSLWMTKSLVSMSSDKTGRHFVILRDGVNIPNTRCFTLVFYLKRLRT